MNHEPKVPEHAQSSLKAYVGCFAGAIQISEYRRLLEEAGLDAIVIQVTGADLNTYAQAGSDCCDTTPAPSFCGSAESAPAATPSSLQDDFAKIMQPFDANAFAASVRIHALQPSGLHQVPVPTFLAKEHPMKTIEVYDPPMCCSSGVCGPQVDPALPRFAADLDWLHSQGHRVDRFNLAQQPQAFIDNRSVHQLISTEGTDCLPLIFVDGQLVSRKDYPSRQTMASWIGNPSNASELPIASQGGGCCGESGCC